MPSFSVPLPFSPSPSPRRPYSPFHAYAGDQGDPFRKLKPIDPSTPTAS